MEEHYDILDDTGKPTGRIEPKSVVHRDGLLHRAVHVWIVTPEDLVLLQKRSARKENHPGLWDVSAAGHVSAGEDAIAAAVREAREELGLSIDGGRLRALFEERKKWVLREGTYIDNEIVDVFLLRMSIDLSSLCFQPEEVDDAALVTIEELRTRVSRRDQTLVAHWGEYDGILDVLTRRA